MQSYLIAKIGEAKGKSRLWLEGPRIAAAGFAAGVRYDVTISNRHVLLRVVESGARVVSSKRRSEHILPIIDINNAALDQAFEGLDIVRIVMRCNEIHVLPLATERKRVERLERLRMRQQAGLPIRIGSMSHGGGVMSHALHNGMAEAGVKAQLAFANDIRADLIDQASIHNDAWNPETISAAAPMQELSSDDWALSKLPLVELVEIGIPCSGASLAGRAKRGLALPEAHPEVGHLAYAFLSLVCHLQPIVVVLENVPSYANTASACIIRGVLKDQGYDCYEMEIRGSDWGAIEDRRRYCLLAVTQGLTIDLAHLEPRAERPSVKVGDILEQIPDDDGRWSKMEGLRAKEVRDRDAGKGFRMSIVNAQASRIGTLTKGIAKNRSTDPKIQHPSNQELLRVPTPIEHARCKGIPEALIAGLSATTAHELLGQSVIYQPFKAIGRAVASVFHRCGQRLVVGASATAAA